MGLDYVRIDDRLIHGQIVTAWCGFLKIAEIVAIDDALAGNKTLQSIALMGVPKQYKTKIVAMAEAKEDFRNDGNGNRLFIVRYPQQLAQLREELPGCEMVVIGNAAKRPDTKFNLTKGGGSVFFASEEDVRLFDELSAQGVKLIYQTVPKSPARDWQDIRKGIKL